MGFLEIRLSQFEARLQSLIEGSAALLFPLKLMPVNLAERLIQAMKDGIHTDLSGELLAPNLFVISVHPDAHQAINDDPLLLDQLADSLQQAGTEFGLVFSSHPVVRLEADAHIPTGEMRVKALDSLANLDHTGTIEALPEQAGTPVLPKAYLIVDGTRVCPLQQPVVNIGRRSDNQLVIDDPRISRLHAQLRLSGSRYILFDLDSSGGTWVNGQRITQCSLSPGDVISLSGVPLIFGQDLIDLGETQEHRPVDHNEIP
ncbi:MAG: FHA domain-containing protein [Anaerolineales bacterium]|nr:FHA domain-containing protein [Anaerolineales bacterium]